MKIPSFVKGLRSFLLLWGSQAVSGLGTAMTDYALIIWAYGQEGTASSITLLTVCSFLPTILFRFIAGALADRWDKKRVMMLADLLAACGSMAVLVLYSFSALRIWHLYLINFLLSCMNAFQAPASFVATSLLVPKEHYTRAGGLQGFSGSAISILAPALGSILLRLGGLRLVLACDMASFALAFSVLLFLIDIPKEGRKPEKRKGKFWSGCLKGIQYLCSHTALMRLTLFFAAVNFLAKLGNDGMLAPFILARTGNDQQALAMVQSATAVGVLTGSLITAGMKPLKNKIRAIFLATALIFVGNILQSLVVSVKVWAVASFASYMLAAIMNANLTAVMRGHVPLELQGRVFSAKDTLQNCTIPLGLLLGGILADYLLEPFMASSSPLQKAASRLFGIGNGAGIAVLFFCVGSLGACLSFSHLFKPIYKELDK